MNLHPIKELRVKHGLTQRQLAELMEISYRSVQEWEGYRRKCPKSKLLLAMEILNEAEQGMDTGRD